MLTSVEFMIFISILFSVTVTNSYVHELRRNDSNLLIDNGYNLEGRSTNSSSSAQKGRASLIIHPKKQFWVEQIARKLAPFFSVISFWNEKCWTAGYDQGTCYSRKECIAKGGTPSGMCAAGFGVCCVFSYSCDSATAFNRTYFLSPEFPYTTHEYGICPHSILKLDDICQIRIDFEVMELARPNKHGYCEEDAFTIHGTDFHMPALCGDLTGHHLYLPVGYDPKITMQISLLSGTPWGRWKIRTTKIKCSSNMLAPPGCQQHLYGTAGRITSFNYFQGEESNMNNLNYGVCVRKERGFCAIQWTLCNHGERKKRSVKSPAVSRFEVQRKTSQMTNSDLNHIPFATRGDGQTKENGFSISRSYAGIHVNRPKPNENVRCWNQRGVPWGSISNRNSSDQMINCPPEKKFMSQKYSSPPPEDVWRPFVPKTNYYVQAEPHNPVKLERRTLGIQIESDNIHTWTNSLGSGGNEVGGLSQVKDQEPINLSPSSGMKNSNPSPPIRKYTLQEQPLRAAGSESTYVTTYSNPIPSGNQFVHYQQQQYQHQHYVMDKPGQHVKNGKDHLEGIGEKVLGIKIPFYTKPKPKTKKVSASASGGIQAGAQVNVDHKPGHGQGSWNKPSISINHKPGQQIEAGYLPPIHNHPKPIHQPGGQIPPIHNQPKPVQSPSGYIPPIHNKPKPDGFPGHGVKPPINVNPKPVGSGAGIGAIPPVAVKPKPALGLGGLFTPGKIKVKPRPNKPLTNGGFGLFGRPKVKPKPILQYKPWGHKDKNKGNGTCKPKVIVVPVPIPLPIPIPIPIVPVVVVPFPFGGGGGGGGGHGGGWGDEDDDDHHKVISVTEPYIIRIVTDEEREEGLSSFCMDWEQIPCDIWWAQHPKFPSSHNEL